MRTNDMPRECTCHTGCSPCSFCTDGGLDICGFCGDPFADKIPHPIRWPGEQSAGTELVHADCEQEETRRAHAALSSQQRELFLKTIQ